MNNNIYSLLIVGNGLDIALEMDTKIDDFLAWVNKLTENKLKTIIKSQNNIKKFHIFIKSYDNWWNNNNNNKINYWRDLENSIILFFEEYENNYQQFRKSCNGKWKKPETAYNDLRLGYELFSFLMQYYYIKKINKKITDKTGKKIKEKIERFLCWVKDVNVSLSLNYTNLKDHVHKNTVLKENIDNFQPYYLHYISFGLKLDNYLRDLNLNNSDNFLNYAKLGDANKLFKLSKIELEKEIREKYCLSRYIQSQFCNNCVKSITGPAKYYQFLILGNSDNSLKIYQNEKYKFLFKNENNNLFLQNYPKLILEDILKKIKDKNTDSNNKILYIFGYSFGNADYFLNSFLENLIQKGWKIKYVFFKEHENELELLKSNMTFYNNFLIKHNLNDYSYDNLELFKKNIKFI